MFSPSSSPFFPVAIVVAWLYDRYSRVLFHFVGWRKLCDRGRARSRASDEENWSESGVLPNVTNSLSAVCCHSSDGFEFICPSSVQCRRISDSED